MKEEGMLKIQTNTTFNYVLNKYNQVVIYCIVINTI